MQRVCPLDGPQSDTVATRAERGWGEEETALLWNPTVETMSRETLAALQLERLRQTLQHVFTNVPLYQQRFTEYGVTPEHLTTLDDLKRFPFTTKSDLRDTYPFGMFAVPMNQVARIHASSGTKGKATVVGYTTTDLDTWGECVARAIASAGGKPGDILHNAYGYGLFTGGLGLHAGAERLGCTVVPASGGFTKRQTTLLQDFGAAGLSCTPSYAVNLAETLLAEGVEPGQLALRYGIFGAEPWSEAMRERIELLLGIDAVDIYGLSEVMGPGVAVECAEQKNGLHVWEDHFIFEVVDPQTDQAAPLGTVGELVFTSLTKEAFPVVRYRTGDLAYRIDEPCACGRTHARMSRIKGRVDDMLIVRGVNVFPQEVEAELLTVPELAPHYQIVLTKTGPLDTMEVHAEWRSEADSKKHSLEAFHQFVQHALHTRLQIAPKLIVHPPFTLARSEGKAVRVVDRREL